MPIPKIIVQTHRDPSIGQEHRQSWIDNHPDYDYRFFDNEACRQFFVESMPKLLAVYDKLPLPVQKADLFRYAYIFFYGGIYADVDTICKVPMESYVNLEADHMVVGVEMTPDRYKFGIHRYTAQYSSPFQILQWTFAASPRHPALAVILDKIRYFVTQFNREQLTLWSSNDRFTLEMTGPMLFTQVIQDFLSGTRQGKVCVLDQLCWGYNPWHNRQISLPNDRIKVRHLFHGSWKPSQGAALKSVNEVASVD
jgi:mannosyltransferase OCH1-like enzyme